MRWRTITLATFTLWTLCVGMCLSADLLPSESRRPNIVWIMAEDISTELGCYGHPAVKTPMLDGLARQGARYTNAFCTAPSCTPSRNAMMTGVYQTRTDTQDQRRRGIVLPKGVKPITHWLRHAGYYTALGCGYSGKTDLNFKAPRLFDGKDWRGREPGQPFFAQITLYETHRLPESGGWGGIRGRSIEPVDPAEVQLPPYFPDHPVCREDWAMYLDAMEFVDAQVGNILKRLEDEGIADNTVVIFSGDNGRCHLRGKCWLYEGGIHVPLIIRWPGQIESNTINDDLVSMIDVSATILDIAGIPLPDYLDGFPILGPRAQRRDCVFAARDLIDEVMDHIRCVRTDRYKYIRNYTPENGYRECAYVQNNRPMLPVIRELHAQGKLNEAQQLLLTDVKPEEELYDLQADPHELNNLAPSPEHRTTLKELRTLLDGWIADANEKGLEQLETTEDRGEPQISETDVDTVWVANQVGFALQTVGRRQYVAYYDRNRVMTVARRDVDSRQWRKTTLPSKLMWDSHNRVVLAVDRLRYVHVSGNMHTHPLCYFRSEKPHDIRRMIACHRMIGQNEESVTYPRFFYDNAGRLLFSYRAGTCGNGNILVNRFEPEDQRWVRHLDTPLFEGIEADDDRAAYHRFVKDAMGRFHFVWMWRWTPAVETCHQLCYATSPDLIHWKNASGKAVALPFRPDAQDVIVDDVPSKGGLHNSRYRIILDPGGRPLIGYVKYDQRGLTQLYVAKHDGKQWVSRQVSNWDFRWQFFEGGDQMTRGGSFSLAGISDDGILVIPWSTEKGDSGKYALDIETLESVTNAATIESVYPEVVHKRLSNDPSLSVNLCSDSGGTQADGVRYLLKWESRGQSRGKHAPNVIPEGPVSQLVVVKIQ